MANRKNFKRGCIVSDSENYYIFLGKKGKYSNVIRLNEAGVAKEIMKVVTKDISIPTNPPPNIKEISEISS